MGRLKSSRETTFSGAYGDKEMLFFPVQLNTSRIGNLTSVHPYSILYVMTIHTYRIGSRKNNRTDNPISYLEKLMNRQSSTQEEVKARGGHYAQEAGPVLGFCGEHGGHATAEVRDVVRTGGGVRTAWGGRKKSARGVSWTTSKFSVSTATSGRLQTRTRGNNSRQRNKGYDISWRNGSLQQALGLDYGIQ